MKIRVLFLYAAFVLLLVFLLGALIWPFLQVDRRLRDFLIRRIDPSFSGAIDLRRAHLGFSSFSLLGLEIHPEKETWSLEVEKITLNFSLLRLITHGFSPQQAITSILIYNPGFEMRASSSDSLSADRTLKWPALEWELVHQLPELLWAKGAQINSGTIQIMDASGKTLIGFSNVDLRMDSPRRGALELHLASQGRGMQTATCNLQLSLNSRTQFLQAHLQVAADSLSFNCGFAPLDSLRIQGTGLRADLHLKVQSSQSSLDGRIGLDGLDLHDGNEQILSSDSLQLEFTDWKLRLPTARAHGMTADWELDGQIADLRNPTLDFSVRASSEDCSGLAQRLAAGSGILPVGKFSLDALIKGDPTHPWVSVQSSLEKLRTRFEAFRDIQMVAEYGDQRLIVNRLEASTGSGAFVLQGQANLGGSSPTAQADFQWKGRLPGSSRAKSGLLQGELFARERSYQLQADWIADGEPENPLTLRADYSAAQASFKAVLTVAGSDAKVDLAIDNFSRQASYQIQFAQPQIIAERLLRAEAWQMMKDLKFSGEVSGPADKLASRILILNEKTTSRLKLNGSLQIRSASAAVFSGDMALRQGSAPPLEGQFSLSWEDSILSLNSLQLDNAISAYGAVNLETGEIGSTELRITNWPLSRGLQIAYPDLAPKWGMVLDGRLELYGMLKQPRADLNFYASQGYFQEHGNFWAVVAAELQDNCIAVKECNIGQGALSLLRLEGVADLTSSTLSFKMRSDLADAADLMNFLGGNPVLLRGPLKLEADLSGTFSQPQHTLTLQIAQGSVYKVPFDILRATVARDSSTNRALILRDFQMNQYPDLSLEAQGVLPFGGQSLDLQFQIKGNILKILHQIEPGILESSGQGELLLQIAQKHGKIQLASASLELSRGKLRFPQVVSEIRSLNVKMGIQGNRLLIENLTCEIDGQGVRIANLFDFPAITGDLQRLYFPFADVDAGIITLETSGRGIHAHIPALMLKGAKSYIGLKGKNGSKYFTISGPIEKPLMRGTITVSSAEITFPFPPSSGSPPGRFVRAVLDVLSSARWDMNIVPERDNRYVHEVKAMESHTVLGDVSELLTTIDVNLNVDPGESGLRLVGSLKDDDFRFIGKLVSTRGSVEYLDFNFRVERFEADFDQYDVLPMVQGRASTVYVDSLGVTRTVYATLYVVDPMSGERKQRGRWGDIIFVLEDDQGSSQEQILAAMGYSPGAITDKVTSLGGTIVSGVVLRGLIRPFERQLESLLQVDVIRLQPTLAQHLFESEILGVTPGPISQIGWGAYMLRQSQLTVGKYVTDDVFLSYTGLWKTGINALNERHFGFLHRWNLDYRMRPVSGNLILTIGYEYDSLEKLEDKKAALRYFFVF